MNIADCIDGKMAENVRVILSRSNVHDWEAELPLPVFYAIMMNFAVVCDE